MDLSKLPVDHGVRMRGEQVTRLETFVDAAFAFAMTLLVVSFDAMPDSFAELYEALRRLPAFLAGFAILAMFWLGHHRFSRRFGLEDATIVMASLLLVAATLFYVYPLRMVMSSAMAFFTGGWAPSEFTVASFFEFRAIFVIYGVGFAVLASIIAWMNLHALRKADALQLDAAERLAARSEVVLNLVLISCAVTSVVVALVIPPHIGWMRALPGMVYGVLGIAMPVLGIRYARRIQALAAQRGAAVIAALERGDKSTRVEAFVDAAFAFALTLLVIAGDRIPESVEELLKALKSLPAYALGFLLMLRFWTAHVAWSRRYGLDDAPTRRLSLLLVFLVLVFVYPMKMVFGVLFSALTSGWLPANFVVAGLDEVPILFVVFGVAFGSLGMVMCLLYAHAWRKRDEIRLSQRERIETRMKFWAWSLVPIVASLSITSALLIPATPDTGWWLGFPGFIYFSLNVATPLLEAWSRRLQARIPVDGAG